jgi:hypothetical protein
VAPTNPCPCCAREARERRHPGDAPLGSGREHRRGSRIRRDSRRSLRVAREPDANPIDVYKHPFAYAAWCGIDCATPESEKSGLRPR